MFRAVSTVRPSVHGWRPARFDVCTRKDFTRKYVGMLSDDCSINAPIYTHTRACCCTAKRRRRRLRLDAQASGCDG
jgi:hypothetical protein